MIDKHVVISLFHILAVVPFFAYIFLKKSTIPEWVYTLLLSLGVFVLLYHAYKSFIRYRAKSSYLWVNLIHVLVVAPIMIYIGYNKKSTPRAAYEILALITFAALGYHCYSIISILDSKELAD